MDRRVVGLLFKRSEKSVAKGWIERALTPSPMMGDEVVASGHRVAKFGKTQVYSQEGSRTFCL